MFSSITVSLLFAIGAGTWVYIKVYRSSGNNNKSALLVGGISGFFLFLLMLTLMKTLFKA